MNTPPAKGISRFIIYTINKLWLLLAAVIILVAVGFSLLRLLLPQIGYFKQDIEAWVLSEYQARISIGQLDARWGEKGPVLVVSDFQLLSAQQNSNLFSIKDFSIHFDGLTSLIEQNFVTERIDIEGAKAQFILGRNLGLTINPLPSNSVSDTEAAASTLDVEKASQLLLSTLFAQKHLSLNRSSINIQTLAGENFNYMIDNLNIRNFEKVHQLSGKLNDEHQGTINLVAEIHGDPADIESHTALYLQGAAIKLSQLPLFDNLNHLKPTTGELNWQLWAQWRNNRWQSAQGDISLQNILWQKPEGKQATSSSIEQGKKLDNSQSNQQNIARIDSLSAAFNWDYLNQQQGLFTLNKVKLQQSEGEQTLTDLPPVYLMYTQQENFDLTWDLLTHNLKMQPLLSLFDVILSSTLNNSEAFKQSELNLNFEHLGVRFLKQKGVWHLPKVSAKFSNFSFKKLFGLPTISAGSKQVHRLGSQAESIVADAKVNSGIKESTESTESTGAIETKKSTEENEIKGISGELGFAYGAGFATLNAKNIKLEFESLFRQPLLFDRLQSAIGWQLSDEQGFMFNINQLAVENGDLNFNSRGQFFLENNKPVLSLYTELTDLDVSKKSLYLPVGVMSDGLVEHLDTGVIDGKLSLVKAVMHGPLDAFPYENPQGVFSILGFLEKASYRYLADWPQANELDVTLLFEGNKMDLQASSAISVGNKVNFARAVIEDMSAVESLLELELSATSFANSGQKLLQQSPLNSLGQSLNAFDIKGEITTDLKINVPLNDTNKTDVSGKVLPNKNNAQLSIAGMTFNQLQGGVYFDQQGVAYSEINAHYHQLPIKAMINPAQKKMGLGEDSKPKNNQQQAELEIQIQGELNRATMADFIGPNWASLVAGKTKFDASVLVSPQDHKDKTIVDVNSDFVGLSFDFPDELFKASADKAPFNFNLAIGEYSIAEINWRKLKAQFLLNDSQSDHTVSTGLFLYNQDKPLTLGLEEKITIDGKLNEVDLLAWHRVLQVGFEGLNKIEEVKANTNKPNKQPKPLIYDIQIELDRIKQDVITLGKTKLQATNNLKNNDWYFNVESGAIDGEFSLISDAPSTLKINHLALDYTPQYIKKLADKKAALEKAERVKSEAVSVDNPEQQLLSDNVTNNENFLDDSAFFNQPNKWPRLNVECGACRILNYNLGQLKAEVKPHQNGVNIKAVVNQAKRLQAKIDLQWLQSSEALEASDEKDISPATLNQTQLAFEMSSDNFGRLMQQWQYPVGIEDSSSNIVAQLSWPNKPWSPDQKQFDGGASFSLGDGYLSELSDAKARLFSLLNIQTLGKRLSLDFKDIYQKGFFYKRLTGDIGFSKGVYITDNIFIDGTAAKVSLAGEVDLVNNQIEQMALVVPQLTSSLPVLVGWAVEPTTGLLVYLLNKIMEPAIDVVSQIEYRIYGDLDEVKVDQISQKKRRVKVEYSDEDDQTSKADGLENTKNIENTESLDNKDDSSKGEKQAPNNGDTI